MSNNTPHKALKSQGQTTELDIIKQLFDSLSDTDKQSFIESLKSTKTHLDSNATLQSISNTQATMSQTTQEVSNNNTIPVHKAKCCPHCNSIKFVKNGKHKNAQRYLCRNCNKTFTDSNNTILFSTKKDIKVWQIYIHCLVEKYSLRKTAKICGI